MGPMAEFVSQMMFFDGTMNFIRFFLRTKNCLSFWIQGTVGALLGVWEAADEQQINISTFCIFFFDFYKLFFPWKNRELDPKLNRNIAAETAETEPWQSCTNQNMNKIIWIYPAGFGC